MFTKAETILNPLFIALAVLSLFFIALRLRGIIRNKRPRIFVWQQDLALLYRISGILKTLILPLLLIGIINSLLIVLLFTGVLYPWVKSLFVMLFSFWILLEIYLSLSISERIPKASLFRRIFHFTFIIILLAGGVILFTRFVKANSFPNTSECVVLELPVRGEWFVGHAGATTMTNPHTKNRYAIDLMKTGSNGLFFMADENDVNDFHSYGEPVYAPADGIITDVVDTLTSDTMGDRDTENPGGNLVILDIGDDKYFYVGHLMKDKIPVQVGQSVKAGTLLGYVGNSGNTFFPHLHIHVQNRPTADAEGRITYPFRFKKFKRRRLVYWRKVRNGTVNRNDRVKEIS